MSELDYTGFEGYDDVQLMANELLNDWDGLGSYSEMTSYDYMRRLGKEFIKREVIYDGTTT